MAKQKKIQNQSILNLPITLSDALQVIQENYEAIKEEEEAASRHEMTLSALQSIQERYKSGNMTSWFGRPKNIEPATLIAFGDEKPEKELVYAVAIDHLRKRITVAFRGSVTPADFFTDACIEFNRRENPLKGKDGQAEKIGIHHGFDEYLLKRRKAIGKDCKYDEIMEYVKELFVGRWDTYKLYVTGHSLGGALASLFAFEAAASEDVPKPVTCVSVASPRVGDESFQAAFTALEQDGKLRHLRIAHSQDPVTMMPKTSTKKILSLLSPAVFVALAIREAFGASQETYRHTGVKLRLHTDKSKLYELSYQGVTSVAEEMAQDDKESKAASNALSGNWTNLSFSSIPGVSYHYGPTYTEQLQKCKEELSVMTLNEIYAKLGQTSG